MRTERERQDDVLKAYTAGMATKARYAVADLKRCMFCGEAMSVGESVPYYVDNESARSPKRLESLRVVGYACRDCDSPLRRRAEG